MPFMPFKAYIDEPEEGAIAGCENCSWSGPAQSVDDIGDCILTPGDPSPVGRCPDCGSLAYIA